MTSGEYTCRCCLRPQRYLNELDLCTCCAALIQRLAAAQKYVEQPAPCSVCKNVVATSIAPLDHYRVCSACLCEVNEIDTGNRFEENTSYLAQYSGTTTAELASEPQTAVNIVHLLTEVSRYYEAIETSKAVLAQRVDKDHRKRLYELLVLCYRALRKDAPCRYYELKADILGDEIFVDAVKKQSGIVPEELLVTLKNKRRQRAHSERSPTV